MAPRCIWYFEVVERIGLVVNRLVLPPYLSKIYNIFHVSLLCKAKVDPSWVLPQVLVEVRKYITLGVMLVQILNRSEK